MGTTRHPELASTMYPVPPPPQAIKADDAIHAHSHVTEFVRQHGKLTETVSLRSHRATSARRNQESLTHPPPPFATPRPSFSFRQRAPTAAPGPRPPHVPRTAGRPTTPSEPVAPSPTPPLATHSRDIYRPQPQRLG